jgi:hypothetical protein
MAPERSIPWLRAGKLDVFHAYAEHCVVVTAAVCVCGGEDALKNLNVIFGIGMDDTEQGE